MKTKCLVLFSALLLSAASFTYAQDDSQPPANKDGQHRPPHNPLLALFDTNHDGVIDPTEIANAPAILKALDKNGDGQLTADELRPPRPKGEKGAPGGKGDGDMPPPPDDAK